MLIFRYITERSCRPLLSTLLRRTMSTLDQGGIIAEKHGEAGLITLNRPKALNALTLKMINDLYEVLVPWEKELGLVVVKGAGEKAFCSGGDIRAIAEAAHADGRKANLPQTFFRNEYILNALIGTYHIPYIALVDGITMGGGVGVSVHGYYRVATERTMFAMPETGIGFFPDVGASRFLPRLGGHLGMFLGLTGARLKGRDVLKAGVATHLCDSQRLAELEAELLSLKNPSTFDIEKILARYTSEATFDVDKPFSLEEHLPKINKYFSQKTVEEIVSGLESDGSEWAKGIAAGLRKASPTSLKVTARLLELGSTRTLQECLQMEYRVAMAFMEEEDIYEGVRAILIEKKSQPKWKPNTLEGVSPEKVARFFAPLHSDEIELQL